jgi:peroxiredoxin
MALERISKLIRSEQFQILGVNIDPKRNLEQARKFIAKHNIGYPSVSDPKQKIFESYGAEIVPTAYLIDREGVVRFVHKGFTPRCEDDIQRKILAVVNELRVASSQ